MRIAFLCCVLFFIVSVSSEETQEKAQVCEPGKAFKKECNTCRCSTDGTDFACTRKSCPVAQMSEPNNDGRRKREINERCEPRSSFKKDCNTCKCNAEGTKAVCTYMRCPEKPRNKRNTAIICEPNAKFNKDCNTCICNSQGTNAKCTLKACSGSGSGSGKSKRDQVCSPGQEEKKPCQIFRCNSKGSGYDCYARVCS